MNPAATTALLAACSPGQRAYEHQNHGVFTHYLLQGLDGAAWEGDQLRFESLARYTHHEVREWSRGFFAGEVRQVPWFEKFGAPQPIILASGRPAPFETTVPGLVVVRDPRFALTFVHPWTVRAGELYQLEVVISNTSTTPVYDLHMNLPSTELSGAQLADPGAAEQVIPELPPGESASVSWELMSLTTGRVVASAFNTSSSMTASFRFHVGVGELGIPLSPDSLVLPPDVYDLPEAWTRPAIELLGLAHSMANAPPGAELTLPPVSEGMVIRRGQELAAAARRASLGEARDRCLLDAGLKWLGTATWDSGWDALRRASRRGHDLERQLGLALGRRIGDLGFDAALEELQRGRGILYDPQVVDACLRLFREKGFSWD